jgi:hypothetical protein
MGDEVLAGAALLASVALPGEGNRALELLTVDRLRSVGLVLLDDGEQVTEQGALIRGELASNRVGPRWLGPAGGLADARMAAAILIAHGTVTGDGAAVRGVGYACALACRNRMASWCLARQAP